MDDCERQIVMLLGPGENGFMWTTKPSVPNSPCGCERIVPYWEHGQPEAVPWFVVYGKDDVVLARVNAAFVEQVRYA
jgi:hypothetical protein